MEKEPRNLLKSGISIDVLIYLLKQKDENCFQRELMKKTNHTQSALSFSLKFLKEKGLITCEKKGRKMFIRITKRGEEIGNKLYEIKKMIK